MATQPALIRPWLGGLAMTVNGELSVVVGLNCNRSVDELSQNTLQDSLLYQIIHERITTKRGWFSEYKRHPTDGAHVKQKGRVQGRTSITDFSLVNIAVPRDLHASRVIDLFGD